jgi:hypothetical protein
MFVNLNYEKQTRSMLSNYFFTLINNNLTMDYMEYNFIDIYFTLKKQFFSKFNKDSAKKFSLKDFFTLISLEYKRFNLFTYSYFWFRKLPYIFYIKRHLNFILDLAFTNVYEFFNKLFLSLGGIFSDGQYTSKRKVHKHNRSIGFIVKNNELVLNNINNNIKDVHAFNYFVHSLRTFSFNHNFRELNNFSSQEFYLSFLEFINEFENNKVQIKNNTNMVDYFNYKPNELTSFDYDFNNLLSLKCSELFSKLEYKNLNFCNMDFWYYIIKSRINLYSRFRSHHVQEVITRNIKTRITRRITNLRKKFVNNINNRHSEEIVLYKSKIDNSIDFKKRLNRLKNGITSSTGTKNRVLIQNEIDFESREFIVEEDSFDLLASNHNCKVRVIELFRLNLS